MILKKANIKRIDENSITFEIDISFKYEHKFSITLENLCGNLFILNEETKITSKDKIGKLVCKELKLKHGKESHIKLDLTLYYLDIFFSNIPKVSFNVEYKIDIVSGKCILPLDWFIKGIRGNIKKVSTNSIEYNIHISLSYLLNCFVKEEKRIIRGKYKFITN